MDEVEYTYARPQKLTKTPNNSPSSVNPSPLQASLISDYSVPIDTTPTEYLAPFAKKGVGTKVINVYDDVVVTEDVYDSVATEKEKKPKSKSQLSSKQGINSSTNNSKNKDAPPASRKPLVSHQNPHRASSPIEIGLLPAEHVRITPKISLPIIVGSTDEDYSKQRHYKLSPQSSNSSSSPLSSHSIPEDTNTHSLLKNTQPIKIPGRYSPRPSDKKRPDSEPPTGLHKEQFLSSSNPSDQFFNILPSHDPVYSLVESPDQTTENEDDIYSYPTS